MEDIEFMEKFCKGLMLLPVEKINGKDYISIESISTMSDRIINNKSSKHSLKSLSTSQSEGTELSFIKTSQKK